MRINNNKTLDEFNAESDEIIKQLDSLMEMDFILVVKAVDGLAMCSTMPGHITTEIIKDLANKQDEIKNQSDERNFKAKK